MEKFLLKDDAPTTRLPGRKRMKSNQVVATTASTPQTTKVPEIVAVDDGTWKIAEKAEVQRMGVDDGLARFCTTGEKQQTIILCSWMPMDVDWTSLFRKFKAKEYILIGECDDGSCGDNWATWGNPAFLSNDIAEELTKDAPTNKEKEKVVPPYEAEGYKRIAMDSLAPYQFSRFDCSVSQLGKTVSFRLRR